MVSVQAYRDGKFTGDERGYDLRQDEALHRFQTEFPQCSDCILVAEYLPEVWIEAAYSPTTDTTFIVEYRRNAEGLLYREEVVGFYHGEPDPELTERYKDLGVVSEV